VSNLAGGQTNGNWQLFPNRAMVPAGTPIDMTFQLVEDEEGPGWFEELWGRPPAPLGETTYSDGIEHGGDRVSGDVLLTNIPPSDPFGTTEWIYESWLEEWIPSPYWIRTTVDPVTIAAPPIEEYFIHNNRITSPVFYYPDLTGFYFDAELVATDPVQGGSPRIACLFAVESRYGVAFSDWDIDFYLSADGVIDQGDTPLGSYHVADRIEPDGVLMANAMFDVPGGAMAPGTEYTVGMIINYKSDHDYPEHDDADPTPRENNANVGLGVDMDTLHPLADLVWLAMQLPAEPLVWGQSAEVTIEVANQGDWDAPAAAVTAWLWSDVTLPLALGSLDLAPLGRGESTGALPWSVPLPDDVGFVDNAQDVYFAFYVDEADVVPEGDESNNSAWTLGGPFIVPVADAPPAPDLVGAVNEHGLAATLYLGQALDVPVVVANGGTAVASGDIAVALYASTDDVLDINVDTLIGETVGQTINLGLNEWTMVAVGAQIPGDLAEGDYYLISAVDSADAIAESDENNNATATQETYEVAVQTNPWHNPALPTDANQNGTIEPMDALVIINMLNAGAGGQLPVPPVEPMVPPPYCDVNGDGYLTPVDALMVINFLNSSPGEPVEDAARLVDPLAGTDEIGDAAERIEMAALAERFGGKVAARLGLEGALVGVHAGLERPSLLGGDYIGSVLQGNSGAGAIVFDPMVAGAI